MGVYRATLFSTYAGQSCVNRWNYISSGSPGGASVSFGLASAMGFVAGFTPVGGGIFQRLQELQSTGVTYDEVQVENIYDPVDFYTLPFLAGENGDNPGENSSPFVAFGFRTSRVRRDIRRGYKRFVGVAESAIGLEGEIAAGAVPSMVALANAMSATLTYDDEGNTLTYVPVVLGLEQYTPASGKPAYRPYDTEAEQLMHVAQGFAWENYDYVRSQTSRQYGRGN